MSKQLAARCSRSRQLLNDWAFRYCMVTTTFRIYMLMHRRRETCMTSIGVDRWIQDSCRIVSWIVCCLLYCVYNVKVVIIYQETKQYLFPVALHKKQESIFLNTTCTCKISNAQCVTYFFSITRLYPVPTLRVGSPMHDFEVSDVYGHIYWLHQQ